MKFLSYVLFLFMVINCNAQKGYMLKEVTYEASTRGKNIQLKISADTLIYKENQKIRKSKIDPLNWKEIKQLVSKIDLQEVENFVPPSGNRSSDRAMHALLKITTNKKEHISQIFDHGNPPKELKPLIDLLFKFTEKH